VQLIRSHFIHWHSENPEPFTITMISPVVSDAVAVAEQLD